MSSFAYGAVTRKRIEAEPEQSTGAAPPGVKTYVDTLAALVPAEVLALHAFILTTATKTATKAGIVETTITDRGALEATFWVCIVLSVALYLSGRLSSTNQPWKAPDYVRTLIPPVAFVLWTILQKTSAWDAVAGTSLSGGDRALIGAAGAIVVGGIASLLAAKANKEQPTAPKPAPPVKSAVPAVVS